MPAFIQVDAFSDKPFSGNPAVVFAPGASYSDTEMQAIAGEMNVSETAFLQGGQGKFDLRWFTPVSEVDLCGHATLASAHALWTEWGEGVEVIEFSTRSGILSVSRGDDKSGLMWMDFPSEPVKDVSENSPTGKAVTHALGVEPRFVGENRMDVLVEVLTEREVRSVNPDLAALSRVETRGVIVTAPAEPGQPYDFVSRFFAPAYGVDEDPVTGSAHCALAPFWASRLGRVQLTGCQASNRSGIVRVCVEGDRVKLGGRAATVFSGVMRNLD